MKKLIVILFALFFASTAYSLTINLTANPTVVDVGDPVTFTAVITPEGAETGPYVFEWDFDDGSPIETITINDPENTVTTTHTYTATGDYQTELEVTFDPDGTGTTTDNTDEDIDIEVYGLTIILTTIPDPATGDIPFTVNLTATATGGTAPYVFEWDFEGDGTIDATENTSGTSNLIHEYTTQDTFTVKVKAIDTMLRSAETTATVIGTIGGNIAPIAETNGPYLNHIGILFDLNSDGSTDSGGGGGPGGIQNYSWIIELQAGNPQCVFTFTGTNSISGNPSNRYRYPEVVCSDIGTAKLTLTVTDNEGATDSAATIIKINPTQTTDKVNIVKMEIQPEILKTGTDLTVLITVRNETNEIQTFDVNYQIKEGMPDTNISNLPNLIQNLELLNQTVNGYSQKEFILVIPTADLEANLEGQKNYWIYATAIVSGENNKIFNKRRAIFNYSAIRTVQLPETNFIGILSVLLISLIILKR